MPHHRTPALLLVALAVTLTASCAGSDPAPAPVRTTSAADLPPIPLPTAELLNAAVLGRMNSAAPGSGPAVIQGADADPGLLERLIRTAAANGMTMTITKVDYAGNGLLNASATVILNGRTLDGDTVIPFVAEDGTWKLQKQWACQMLTNAGQSSPACP
ncbi:hypothetical protein [Nocardia sp. NPDC056100]|uniref:hypothetical protein n=1 Tax=Nocardia sp. NPDC056100 TaxID=3345712 RepID=UPI0035DAED84